MERVFLNAGADTCPHPVSQAELKTAFNPVSGWNVIAMESEGVLTNFHEHGAAVWLATIKRI